MNNLGKANVKVEILSELPLIDRNATKYNFDVTAHQWGTMQKSPYFPPLFTECIIDDDESFSALFPSKRKHYVHNYIRNVDGSISATETNALADVPIITFSAIGPSKGGSNVLENQGVVTDIFNPKVTKTNPDPYTSYILEPPQSNGKYSTDYIGPKWENCIFPKISSTNDIQGIVNFLTFLGSTKVAETWVEEKTNDNSMGWINQHVVRDGLWWGIESNQFLYENMPFWVSMAITRTPATTNHATQFIISLGLDDDTQAYDIILSHNNKPKIVDYYQGRKPSKQNSSSAGTDTGVLNIIKEFDSDLSRFLDVNTDIEIGIMTIGGRLIVSVGGVDMIYTRVEKKEGDENGIIKECKIAPGKIRIWGTNVQAAINVSPMTFAPMSALALPLPSFVNEAAPTSKDAPAKPVQIVYAGVNTEGVIGGPVCVLPQQPNIKGKLYGVDCATFTDYSQGSSISPTGLGFHRKGIIAFASAGRVGVTNLPSSDFYVLIMKPLTTIMQTPNGPKSIKYGGCPYFFRIKGAYDLVVQPTFPKPVVITDVISISETSTASDYFQAATTASVVLYNEGGRYDYLKNTQFGIRLYWGWGNELTGSVPEIDKKVTFTGVIVSATTSEVPGKETITLQCEDYMYIFKNTFIVNSPFYDGMVAFYAIQDLAKRGGSQVILNAMQGPRDYFLPSGYSFSKPVMRFPSKNTIFNCLMDVVKRFEAFIYFNQYGELVVDKLPGGLFSAPTKFVAEFTRNPDTKYVSNIILNEKNMQYDFNSTINKISVFTLDRDTRNAILYTRSAMTGNENHILFNKVMLLDQPALGDIEVARTYAERLGKRVFWPIRKTSFSTVGGADAVIGKVLDFVKVDGQEFRVTSIAKKYSADNNDFTVDYMVEWLGGK